MGSSEKSPYRALAIVPAYPPAEPHHLGPRRACPLCSQDIVYNPYGPNFVLAKQVTACSGASWLGRLFGGCKRRDFHGHQRCRACGAKWIIEPMPEEAK